MLLDSTCYVGCSPPTTGIPPTTTPPSPTTVTTIPGHLVASPPAPLAFTGADIAGLVIVAVICIAVGFTLWRLARRRRAAGV